jgi:hypothetical protein
VIAVRTTTQAAEQTERDLVGRLLLAGIEHTNARPWIAGVGMAAVYVLFVLLQQVMP